MLRHYYATARTARTARIVSTLVPLPNEEVVWALISNMEKKILLEFLLYLKPHVIAVRPVTSLSDCQHDQHSF